MELPKRFEGKGEGGQVAAVRPEDHRTTRVNVELHLVTLLSTCIRDVAALSRSRSSSLTVLLLEAPPTRFLL